MEDDLPASPCVRDCCLDQATDVCLGCFRTLAEILAWHTADAEERRRIITRCEQRRLAHEAARHGRRDV